MTKRSIFFLICLLAVGMIASGGSGDRQRSGVKAAKIAAIEAARGSAESALAGTTALPSTWGAVETVSNTVAVCDDCYAAVDAKSNVYASWVEWYGGVGSRRDMMFNTNKTGKWGTPHANTLVYPLIDDVGFPEVTVTKSGNNAIYAWMDASFSMGQMVIYGEELANGSWSGPGIISTQAPDSATYPSLSASPLDNSICFVWQQAVSGFQLANQYRDGTSGGMSSPALINESQPNQYWPNVIVDGKGTAHLVYITRSGLAQVWYTKNANVKSTSTWTAPVALSGYTGLDWVQPIVQATDAGDAYVVWQEVRNNVEDVFLTYQISGVWQSTINVTNTTAAAPCESPSIAVNSATGDMYIVWIQLTGSGHGNIFLKTYETNKTTGQKSWSDPIQVTTSGLATNASIRATSDPDLHIVYVDNGKVYHVSRLAPRLAAVGAPTVTSAINRVLFASEKNLTITFAKNTVNDDTTLASYKLYSKKYEDPDTAYTVLATFSPTDTFQYVWKKLAVSQRYSFVVGVVNKDGLELKSPATVSN